MGSPNTVPDVADEESGSAAAPFRPLPASKPPRPSYDVSKPSLDPPPGLPFSNGPYTLDLSSAVHASPQWQGDEDSSVKPVARPTMRQPSEQLSQQSTQTSVTSLRLKPALSGSRQLAEHSSDSASHPKPVHSKTMKLLQAELEPSMDVCEQLMEDARWWRWTPKVFLQTNEWYMRFWYFTMFYAMLNAVLDPYDLAFGSTRNWRERQDFWSYVEFVGTVVFFVDIVLKFFLAYEDEERKELVTEFKPIAKHYLSFMFWMDLLFWFPFVGVILTSRPDLTEGTCRATVEIPDCEISTGYYIGLLGFLKLGRLYRLFHLFDHLDHAMIISQISLMLLRNFVYIMLTCHWFACIFYFIARAEQYSVNGSWIGRNIERFDGQPASILYIYSFYLSVTAFAGLGDGDFYSNSPAESIAMSIYMLFNVVLGAYILGTVTMLMVKNDERSKSYRDRISNLTDYSVINELPPELKDDMRAHLELHYQSEMCSDEYVLALYPSAIRRKVLRHLYLEPLRQCYLLKSAKPKFLDAVLAACRTDLFMPHVHLINEGDIVSELYMLIEGEVQVMTMTTGSDHDRNQLSHSQSLRSFTHSHNQLDSGLIGGPAAAAHSGGQRRGTSECFGEVGFFTETPSADVVWTMTVVRVLVLPRAAYSALSASYPNQVRNMVNELRRKTEQDVLDVMSDALDTIPSSTNSIHVQLLDYLDDIGALRTADLPPPLMLELKAVLTPQQRIKLEQVDLIKGSVLSFCIKQDRLRVYEMLNCASKGEDEHVKALLSQGVSAACEDCDRRTPLILAAQEGKESTVKLLLDAGASPRTVDVFGQNALLASIKHGHDFVSEVLVAAGACLQDSTAVIMGEVLESILDGDLAKLARFMRGGADPNMANHDRRTPLHMAAAEGSIAAVRLLIDAGADIKVKDRWGNLPLDDAKHARAMPVVEYIENLVDTGVVLRRPGQGQAGAGWAPTIGDIRHGGGSSGGVKALLGSSNNSRQGRYKEKAALVLAIDPAHSSGELPAALVDPLRSSIKNSSLKASRNGRKAGVAFDEQLTSSGPARGTAEAAAAAVASVDAESASSMGRATQEHLEQLRPARESSQLRQASPTEQQGFEAFEASMMIEHALLVLCPEEEQPSASTGVTQLHLRPDPEQRLGAGAGALPQPATGRSTLGVRSPGVLRKRNDDTVHAIDLLALQAYPDPSSLSSHEPSPGAIKVSHSDPQQRDHLLALKRPSSQPVGSSNLGPHARPSRASGTISPLSYHLAELGGGLEQLPGSCQDGSTARRGSRDSGSVHSVHSVHSTDTGKQQPTFWRESPLFSASPEPAEPEAETLD